MIWGLVWFDRVKPSAISYLSKLVEKNSLTEQNTLANDRPQVDQVRLGFHKE